MHVHFRLLPSILLRVLPPGPAASVPRRLRRFRLPPLPLIVPYNACGDSSADLDRHSERNMHPGHEQHASGSTRPGKELLPIAEGTQSAATDPVCGMTVDPAQASYSLVHDGRTYYFCCGHCLEKFRADPSRYLNSRPPEPAQGTHPPAASYTCPMHPEVISDRPGTCPKCGMALEPRDAVADTGPNPELVDMSRRFWVGVVLSLPLLLISMSEMIPGNLLHDVDMRLVNWVQLFLATPVVWWCGWPFFERAWASILHGSANMFTLIALGVGAAYL